MSQATATTDGTGSVDGRVGAPDRPRAAERDLHRHPHFDEWRDAPTAATGVTGLSHTFTGLALGRAYSFSVVAVNTAGASDPAATTQP